MKNRKQIKGLDNNITIIDKKINDNGYLVLNCIFARTGIQERYGAEISPDFEQTKLYKEYRSPAEVFKTSVLEAFKNIVITNDHPQEQLDSTNTKFHAIGFVSSTVEIIDNSYLQCEITIFCDDTIEDIQAGKVELSAGYLYNLLIVEDEDYDYIQTDIKPNHIAIVQAGRCGSICSLAFDKKPNSKQGKKMLVKFKKLLPDGTEEIVKEVEIADEELAKTLQVVADSLFKATSPVKATDDETAKDKEIETLKTESKVKSDEIDKLQAEADTNKTVATDSVALTVLATDLAGVMMVAKDSGICVVGKDIQAIKTEVVKKYEPNIDLAGRSAEYLGYAFDNVSQKLAGADSDYKKANVIKPSKAILEEQKATDEASDSFQSKYGGTL